MFSLRAQQLILTAAMIFAGVAGSFLLVHEFLRHGDSARVERTLQRLHAQGGLWRVQLRQRLDWQTRALANSHWLAERLAVHHQTAAMLPPGEVPGLSEGEGFLWISRDRKILSAGVMLYPLLRDHPLLERVFKEGLGSAVIVDREQTWWLFGRMLGQQPASAVFYGVPVTRDLLQPLAEASRSTVVLVGREQAVVAAPPGRTLPSLALDSLRRVQAHAVEQPRFNLLQDGLTLHGTVLADPTQRDPTILLLRAMRVTYPLTTWLFRFALLGVALLVIGVGAMYWLTDRWPRRIQIMRQAVDQAARDNFQQRVRVAGGDEFSPLAEAFNQLLQSFAEKERMRRAMEKVVSKQIAFEILQGDLNLDGEERAATILYADIQRFSRVSFDLRPAELLEFLNNYFTRMSFCIDAHNGVIDKYQGDAFSALFGIPTQLDNDALAAVIAALDLLEALQLFNLEVAQPRGKRIKVGIGIHSGQLIAGNLGAEDRLNYSVIGETVNLVTRLQGLTKLYDVAILISGESLDRIQLQGGQPTSALFHTRQLDNVQIKSHLEPMPVWEILPHNAPGDLPDRIQQFDHARDLAMARSFQAALDGFQRLYLQWPEDNPTRLWTERCRRYVQNPAAFDQDYPEGALALSESGTDSDEAV